MRSTLAEPVLVSDTKQSCALPRGLDRGGPGRPHRVQRQGRLLGQPATRAEPRAARPPLAALPQQQGRHRCRHCNLQVHH